MEIVEKIAERYVSKQKLLMPEDVGELGIALDSESCEIASLLWFYDMANRQRLPLPGIPRRTLTNELLDIQELRKSFTSESYIQDWSGIAAVAQHYGIPTRMLDWTFDVNVALYFAVKGLPDKGSEEYHPEFVSLWILYKSKASIICEDIRFVMPGYSDNPNIGAQSGLFSVVEGGDPGKDLKTLIVEAYDNASPEKRSWVGDNGVPILKKCDIPYETALRIKKGFEDRGISYDYIFPGFSGVAESMKIQSGIHKG